jgi:hypothetical protein
MNMDTRVFFNALERSCGPEHERQFRRRKPEKPRLPSSFSLLLVRELLRAAMVVTE